VVAAHVVVAFGRSRERGGSGAAHDLAVGVRVNRVQVTVAGVEIRFAVILLAAALAEGLEDHGALGIFSAVVRHQDFHLADHVLVDVGNLRTGVARIHQVCAVQHVGHGAVGLRAV